MGLPGYCMMQRSDAATVMLDLQVLETVISDGL